MSLPGSTTEPDLSPYATGVSVTAWSTASKQKTMWRLWDQLPPAGRFRIHRDIVMGCPLSLVCNHHRGLRTISGR